MLRLCSYLCLVLAATAAAPAIGQDYSRYQKYIGKFPQGETDWSDDAQGVAHDDNNWYITTTHSLWKIPVELNLDSVEDDSPGVMYTTIFNISELDGYNHFGDPDVYNHHGVDYLILPIEDEHANCQFGPRGAIAILRCDTLCYVGHAAFTNQCNDAGWCAIHPNGEIFTSLQHIGVTGGEAQLLRYALNWDALDCDTPFQLTFLGPVAVTKEDANPLDLHTMQGGQFDADGGLLYLISGFHDDDDEEQVSEGLHIVDTASWRRVAHSTNGFGQFNYYYDTGFTIRNEPEGLTLWDLDDGRAPGIRGQLHAFMSDNDVDAGDIYFYHYTHILRVESGASCEVPSCCTNPEPFNCVLVGNTPCGDELAGLPQCPMHTITEAANQAWAGSEIRITAGTYLEALTISQRVRLRAEGGLVRIGG